MSTQLGLPSGYNVVPEGFSQNPNQTGGSGSSYYGGLQSQVVKALRQLNGEPVAQPFSATTLGVALRRRWPGRAATPCSARRCSTRTTRMSATNGGSTTPSTWTANAETQAGGAPMPQLDAISFAAVGVAGQPNIDWQNRPTFQQVVEFTGTPVVAVPEAPSPLLLLRAGGGRRGGAAATARLAASHRRAQRGLDCDPPRLRQAIPARRGDATAGDRAAQRARQGGRARRGARRRPRRAGASSTSRCRRPTRCCTTATPGGTTPARTSSPPRGASSPRPSASAPAFLVHASYAFLEGAEGGRQGGRAHAPDRRRGAGGGAAGAGERPARLRGAPRLPVRAGLARPARLPAGVPAGRPYWAGPRRNLQHHVHGDDAARALLTAAQRRPTGGSPTRATARRHRSPTSWTTSRSLVGRSRPLHLPGASRPFVQLVVREPHMQMVEIAATGPAAPQLPGWRPQLPQLPRRPRRGHRGVGERTADTPVPPLPALRRVRGGRRLAGHGDLRVAPARPYFGNTTVVWANVIGLILVYLSVGYWLGGRVADRHPHPRVLGVLLLVAAAAISVLPFIAQPFLQLALQGFSALSIGVVAGSFFATLLLFSVPVSLLGMVSPFAVRLAVRDVRTAGTVSGRLSSLTTIGAIVGTFAPALLLIPAIGTQRTLLCAALLVSFAAVPLLPRRAPIVSVVVAGLLLIPPAHGQAGGGGRPRARDAVPVRPGRPHARRAHRAAARRRHRRPVGVPARTPCSPAVSGTCRWWCPPLLDRPMRRALVIGNAGGTMARALAHEYPGVQIDGVEPDPAVSDIGRQLMGMAIGPRPARHRGRRPRVPGDDVGALRPHRRRRLPPGLRAVLAGDPGVLRAGPRPPQQRRRDRVQHGPGARRRPARAGGERHAGDGVPRRARLAGAELQRAGRRLRPPAVREHAAVDAAASSCRPTCACSSPLVSSQLRAVAPAATRSPTTTRRWSGSPTAPCSRRSPPAATSPRTCCPRARDGPGGDRLRGPPPQPVHAASSVSTPCHR